MKTIKTIKAAILALMSATVGSLFADPIDFTTPLVFSGNTEITESEDSGWNKKQTFAVNVTGTGNVLNGKSGEANPWRQVYLTGDGYLTMTRNGQWSIGFDAVDGGTTNFYGTLHIIHQGWSPVYFGAGKGTLSMANAKVVLQPRAQDVTMEVYMSNDQTDTRFGDLSTTGDYGSSVVVRHKVNNATLRVGYRNENSTFAGSFVPNGGNVYNLDKVGTGAWTLQGPVSINGTFSVSEGTVVLDGNTVSCAMTVASGATIRGTGTISGAVSAASGARLLYSAEEVLTFTEAANLDGFIVDATGCDAEQEYLVAKGTTSLPGVSAAQSAQGWMTEAKNGNVYLVNHMTTITSSIVLDADADWSGNVVSVADAVTIDLNGHSLSVAGITFGTGVTFVNNGAEKSRLYAGLSGADKSWLLGLNLAANIMPVFVGAAIEIPQTFVPAGGIGFKNTSGTQLLYYESCANGLAFLGNAIVKEPFGTWNLGSLNLSCVVTVEGSGNAFQFDNNNGYTEPPVFEKARFAGDGILAIRGSATASRAAIVGNKDTVYDGFSGTIQLCLPSNFAGDLGQGVKFEDDNVMAKAFTNGTLSLVWDGTSEVLFTLRTQNYSTPPTYNIGNLVTDGEHPEKILLRPRYTGSSGTHIKDYTLKVGWKNEDGVFAGCITNEYYQGVDNDVAFAGTENINIEKHGTGTWKLTGTVANGGTFAVATGGVEFRKGLANVTSLTVASGASVLFAGDMGSNPIALASGSTLKLDASNEGDDVPVVNGNLDLTGVSIYVSQGTYVPSKTEPRELLRIAGTLTGFDRNDVATDIDVDGWVFRVVDNGDGTKSIVHKRRIGMSVVIR